MIGGRDWNVTKIFDGWMYEWMNESSNHMCQCVSREDDGNKTTPS